MDHIGNNPFNPNGTMVASPDAVMYRTEDFAGEGYRDPARVLTHETYEMGNADAALYMLQHWLVPGTELFREGEAVYNWADTFRGNPLSKLSESGEDSEDMEEERIYGFFIECLKYIRKLTGKNLTFGLWLAKHPVVEGFYCGLADYPCTIDAYETEGGVVLDDLGYDGMFIGFEHERFPSGNEEVRQSRPQEEKK